MHTTQRAHGRTSLLKTVVLGVGLGSSLGVETTQLYESGRLLSVGSADILEMFAKCVRVISSSVVNRVVNSHNASKREYWL
jgi:hypothetical protein